MKELSGDIPPRLLRDLAAAPLIPEDEIDAYVHSHGTRELSEPELLVLSVLSHGPTEQMAADLLGKSIFTVMSQSKAARYKLKAKNTTHAVALALRAGLID